MEVKKPHFRSSQLGHVLFRDKESRLYRDVDLKGIGNIEPGSSISSYPYRVGLVDPIRGLVGRTEGILNREFAENDITMAENFLKWGIRTYRAIGLIKLNEIIDQSGNKISVKEAKEKGLLKYRDEPVVEIRAFGSRSRIQDIPYEYEKEKNRNMLLNDAKIMVAQELGVDGNKFSDEKYVAWMLEVMAQNIARIHSRGLIHGYLTDHNITLDGRIVDLDSVETLKEIAQNKRSKKSFVGDLKWVIDTLLIFYAKLFPDKLKQVPENEYRVDLALVSPVYKVIAYRFIREYFKELKKLNRADLFNTIRSQLINQDAASMWFDKLYEDQKKFFISAFKKAK